MATLLNPRQFFAAVLLVLLLELASCATKQTVGNTSSPAPSAVPTSAATGEAIASSTPTPATPLSTATPTPDPNSVSVTLYRADDQCEGFVPETVRVSKQRAMESAIGKVLAEQRNADFDLVGYRVNRSPEGIVTIDLRLAPDSKRQIVSLSSCEQLALFGSLRETLARNPQWRVKSVHFTERGKAIVL